MIPKIIISRPKIIADYKCPKCKHIDIVALQEVTTTCKNCKTKITTNADINITFAVWKDLMQKLANSNQVTITGEIYSSEIVDISNALNRFGNHDDDIYSALLSIQHTLRKHQNYDVGEITVEDDTRNETTCKDCGYCLNCKQCKNCGKTYVPKQVSTKDGKQNRYTCPGCNNKTYENSRINKAVFVDNKKVCPHCKSDNIVMTSFNSFNKTCPKCGGKNINDPKKIKVYKMIINRQKRFEIQK